VVWEPGTQYMEGLLKVIYELYKDYVLKTPCYEMEMPIRCELFDITLTQTIQKDLLAASFFYPHLVGKVFKNKGVL
jgi:trafficking protein particle complex subunit 4